MKTYSIVVTYNGAKWIKKCLNSLVESSIPIEIIVIDNHSEDDTLNIIEKEFPKVKLVKSLNNIGFGKANNIGIKIAVKDNADFIFLLNQDAWIEPNTLLGLIKINSLNPEFGILSPFHIAGNQTTIDSLFSTYITQKGCNNLLSDLFFNKEKLLDVYETNFVNAAFWLLSKNCLNTVGGFDPIFYIYGEDDDYINRVIGHNLKIGICPKLIGYHDRPQNSSDNLNINKLNAKELLFAKTELPPKKYFLFKYLFYLIFSIFHYDDSNKGKIKILLRIFKDYKTIQQHHNLSKKNGLTFL